MADFGIGEAAAILAVVGTAVTTYAAVQGAEAQASAARAEKKFRERAAQSERDAAAFEEAQFRNRVRHVLGQQQAIGAAAGIETTTGSPLLNELDAVRQGELQALSIRQSGATRAYSQDFAAAEADFMARYAQGRVPGIIAGGVAQAGSSVLGYWGAGGKWGGWTKKTPQYTGTGPS